MLQNLDSPDAKERVRLQSRLSGILLDEYAAQKKSNAGEGGGANRPKKSCNNIYLQHIQLYRLPSCNFETVLGLMAQPAIYSVKGIVFPVQVHGAGQVGLQERLQRRRRAQQLRVRRRRNHRRGQDLKV